MSEAFRWSEEQEEFRAILRKMLEARAPLSRNRALAEAGERHDPDLWRSLAVEIGLQGIALPEHLGGSGQGRLELAIGAGEMGRVLYGGPFLSTVVLAAEAILVSEDQAAAERHLPAVAAGETTATLAVLETPRLDWRSAELRTTATPSGDGAVVTGTKELVLDGADADTIIVLAQGPGGPSLYLVDGSGPGVVTEACDPLDLTRPLARVRLDEAPGTLLGAEGRGAEILERVLEGTAIFLAAEQAAASQACIDLTADYARTRTQFGQPIGRFQGVKHRLADMAVRQELASASAIWAAWQEPGSDEARLGARVALSHGSESFAPNAFDTIQLHGGIAITWEHDAHLFLRRAQADLHLLGTPRQHRARLAEGLVADLSKGDSRV